MLCENKDSQVLDHMFPMINLLILLDISQMSIQNHLAFFWNPAVYVHSGKFPSRVLSEYQDKRMFWIKK